MASNRELRPFGLETFSLWCAKRLLERHPEWLPFVEPAEHEQDGLPVRTLTINLPSQNPGVPESLSLGVDLGRILWVSWLPLRGGLRWHVDWVFYMPGFPTPSDWRDVYEGVDIVADYIERFQREEIAAIWTINEDGSSTSTFVSAQEVRTDSFRKGKVRTEIRSWRGTLDQTLVGR